MTDDRGGWTPEVDRQLVSLLPKIEQALELVPDIRAEQAALAAQIEERNKWAAAEIRGLNGRLDEHAAALNRDKDALSDLRSELAIMRQRVDTHNGTAVLTDEQQLDLAVMHIEVEHLRDACEKMDGLEQQQHKLERTQYVLGLAIVVFSLYGPDIGDKLMSIAGALIGVGP